jgi:uncharacterized protein (TIGR02391 family)
MHRATRSFNYVPSWPRNFDGRTQAPTIEKATQYGHSTDRSRLRSQAVHNSGEASGMSDLDGVDLMRKAFHTKNGTLTDKSAKPGEKQARTDLFAGAMGSYRNPQAHRYVNLDNPTEAVEIIMLANHLLRIVDARAKAAKNT